MMEGCVAEKRKVDSGISDARAACKVEGILHQGSERVEGILHAAIGAWHLDTLLLAEVTENRPLSTLGVFLFSQLGFVDTFKLDLQKVTNFFVNIEDSLNVANSYHNRAHVASVMHSMHAILHQSIMKRVAVAAFTGMLPEGSDVTAADCSLAVMTCLIAAALHDYEHLGVTNDYLVNTCHERALCYEGKHVNEKHHAAAGLDLLCQPESNFLAVLPSHSFYRVCDIVTDMILATDMAKHSDIVAELQAMLGNDAPEGRGQDLLISQSVTKDSTLMLQVALKCADLGHLTMPWDLHLQWVQRLEKEFFVQGDKEKQMGLSISFLMDRSKPGVTESQQGFFEFVVVPLFSRFARAAPATKPLLQGVLENYDRWQKIPDAKEEMPNSRATFSKISTGSSFHDACSPSCASSPSGQSSRASSPVGESWPDFSLADGRHNDFRNEDLASLSGNDEASHIDSNPVVAHTHHAGE